MCGFEKYRKCPSCGAKTEEEAQRLCIANDNCPMSEETWEECLDEAERIAIDNEYYGQSIFMEQVNKILNNDKLSDSEVRKEILDLYSILKD